MNPWEFIFCLLGGSFYFLLLLNETKIGKYYSMMIGFAFSFIFHNYFSFLLEINFLNGFYFAFFVYSIIFWFTFPGIILNKPPNNTLNFHVKAAKTEGLLIYQVPLTGLAFGLFYYVILKMFK
jgi:hypothetical protein